MIYFMQPVDGGPVKIGFSEDVKARQKQLEAHYGRSLVVLATRPGGAEEEKQWHATFAHLRLGKTEQFRPRPYLMRAIGADPALLVNPEAGIVEAMRPTGNSVPIIHLKGSPAYADWLDGLHKKTHVGKATLFRLGVAEIAKQYNYPEPPEI